MKFYGIDLHTDSFISKNISFTEPNKITGGKYYFKDESFKKFLSVLSKDDYILIESCSNAFWFYDQVKPFVKECYILNTIKYNSKGNKLDKLDAEKLVKQLLFYIVIDQNERNMQTIYVPKAEIRELRALFTTYKMNKKTINQNKNRIYSILKANGLQIEKEVFFKKDGIKEIESLCFKNSYKLQLLSLVNQIKYIETQCKEIRKEIEKLGYETFKNEIELLITINGFSIFTAVGLMTDIVDIKRFSSSKKFCSYLRTSPGVKGSNKKTKIGGTNKASRPLTCWLISQSIAHFSNSGDYLSDFYKRVKVGKKAGVYRMALMRKILVSAYHMLKNKKQFYWINENTFNRKLKELDKMQKKIKKAA